MRDLQLTRGKVALVDDEYFNDLSRYRWYCKLSHGHWFADRPVKIEGGTTTLRLSGAVLSLAGMTPAGKYKTNYKNGDTLDNRLGNLEIVFLNVWKDKEASEGTAWRNETSLPDISFQDCKSLWFQQGIVVQSVLGCPDSAFKAFIAHERPSGYHDVDVDSLLAQDSLDDAERWFVLSELARVRRLRKMAKLPLYTYTELNKFIA